MVKWIIHCCPSQCHTVMILALKQSLIQGVDRLYPFASPSPTYFLAAKRMTRMVCNGKGCPNLSQNVTACKNFTSRTCAAAEVFCSTNLRTHAHVQTHGSGKHISELELPKQTSPGSHAWLGAAAGTLRPVLRWANGVWVAITQAPTHGDCQALR